MKSLPSARAGETNEKALWNFTACWRALKSIRYLWFYLAELDDSNAETVQIYGKSVLSKFSRCAVNIHLIFDREKFALCTRWRDKRESPLKFHGTASFEKYSISLVLFGTIGWFKRWNSPNLQKKVFYRSSYDAPLKFIQFFTGKILLSARTSKTETSLKFHGMPASIEKYSISLVLFGRIGWFKRWNSPNLQKKLFYRSSYNAL